MTNGLSDQDLAAVLPNRSASQRRIQSLRRGLSIDTTAGHAPPAKADGLVARIGKSLWFQNVTLCVIVLNALWIAVDIEWNHPRLERDDGRLPLQPYSTIMDNLFCVFYVAEIIIQLFSFQNKLDCVKDKWFIFDSVLVTFMVFETWLVPIVMLLIDSDGGGTGMVNLSALRTVRLLRITRMVRLMKFVPELFQLAKMIVRACRATSCILAILMLTIYVWGIFFTSFCGTPNGGVPLEGMEDEDPTASMLFASLGSSMMTLFTNGVLQDNLAQTLTAIKKESLVLMWLFIGFQMLCAFMILNMLIGFLCQQVLDVTKSNNHALMTHSLSSWFAHLFGCIGDEGVLTLEDWDRLVKNPDARALLDDGDGNVDERVELLRAALFGEEFCGPGTVAAFHAATATELCASDRVPRAVRTATDAATLAARMDRQSSNSSMLCSEGSVEAAWADAKGRPRQVDRDHVENILWTLFWDSPASALEVEAFKKHMRRQKRSIQRGIQRIEEKLETFVDDCVKAGTAGASGAPGSATVPVGRQDCAAAYPELGGSAGKRREGAASHWRPLAPTMASTTRPPPAILQSVPSGLLLHVLRLRQPEYSRKP